MYEPAHNASCDLLEVPSQKPACVCSPAQVSLAPLKMCMCSYVTYMLSNVDELITVLVPQSVGSFAECWEGCKDQG